MTARDEHGPEKKQGIFAVNSINPGEKAVSNRARALPGDALSTALALCAVGLLVAGIAYLAAARHYFGFGTESDFLGSFLGEAQAFLQSGPLAAQYHPPLYAICIALLHTLLGDWFTVGRILSVASAATVLLASFFFYRASMSRFAAWGALAGLAASPIFIEYATLATTDIFFLALYSLLLLLAYYSEQRSSPVLWLTSGIVLGFALLTRTNAVTLLLIFALPWLASDRSWRRRTRDFSLLMAGTTVPVATWIGYALASHSNPLPMAGTATNLALHYFPPHPGESWADGVTYAQSRFPTIWSVVAHDPTALTKRYVRDLYQAFQNTLSTSGLFVFPMTGFALPALLYAVMAKQSKWVYYILALSAGQLLLVNLMDYQTRFYLFLVPVIGALTAEFIGRVFWQLRRRPASIVRTNLGQFIILMLLAVSAYQAITTAGLSIRGGQTELDASIPAAETTIPDNAVVVERKPVIGYYTGARNLFMPAGTQLDDLLTFVARLSPARVPAGGVYIYYGKEERHLRPEYRALLDTRRIATQHPELKLLARSLQPGKAHWVIYRYRPDTISPAADRPCRSVQCSPRSIAHRG